MGRVLFRLTVLPKEACIFQDRINRTILSILRIELRSHRVYFFCGTEHDKATQKCKIKRSYNVTHDLNNLDHTFIRFLLDEFQTSRALNTRWPKVDKL